MALALTAALALAGSALTVAAKPAADSDAARAAARQAEEAVLRLIGTAACKTDADCRTAAVGSKACGGPQRYLAWSVRQTDGSALDDALARQAAVAAPAGSASTCAFIADPGARCAAADVGGGSPQCVLGGTADHGTAGRR